jgi:Fur family transcriptional regulator, ferric uptake regulator
MIQSNVHRNTRQRKIILEELRKLSTHPTATALYAIVRRRMPKISLGTVYRNLEFLNRMQMIRKLDFGSEEARYDGNLSDHDHLRCILCMRIDDLPGPPLALSGEKQEDWNGYEVLGRRLEYFGICPQCRGRRNKQSKPAD